MSMSMSMSMDMDMEIDAGRTEPEAHSGVIYLRLHRDGWILPYVCTYVMEVIWWNSRFLSIQDL
jgi:hypothetical protein